MGWRTKFVFLLIVYCAGFATAIYCLAPTPDGKSQAPLQLAQVSAAVKPQELIKSFNSGMHKCFGFSKEAALETAQEAAKLLQVKMNEALKSQPKEK
jgi:hypothetical protein